MRALLEKDESRGAQRALNYLGVVGTAMFVSLDGDIFLSSLDSDAEWLAPIAMRVAACAATIDPGSPDRIASLDSPGACTYFARVGSFGAIVVLTSTPIAPVALTERFSRVLAVFDKVLGPPSTTSGGAGGPTGAPALVSTTGAGRR